MPRCWKKIKPKNGTFVVDAVSWKLLNYNPSHSFELSIETLKNMLSLTFVVKRIRIYDRKYRVTSFHHISIFLLSSVTKALSFPLSSFLSHTHLRFFIFLSPSLSLYLSYTHKNKHTFTVLYSYLSLPLFHKYTITVLLSITPSLSLSPTSTHTLL